MDRIDDSDAVRAQARGLALRRATTGGAPLRPGRGFVDLWDLIMNPYIGCEFACAYCYAVNLRPQGTDRDEWGSWTDAKIDLPELLERMLYGPTGNTAALDGKTIMAGTATDPYQPVEKSLQLTWGALLALAGRPSSQPAPMFGAPAPRLCIQTRSPLVCRDLDLLEIMRDNGADVQVNMTITTDSEAVRREIEPACMSNDARLTAVRRIADRGIDACITVTPFLAVDDEDAFADRLANSGAVRLISQQLHPTERPDFQAASRPGSDEMVRRIHQRRGDSYDAAYRRFRDRLRAATADRPGLTWMGEGKHGFRPPWPTTNDGIDQAE